MALELENSERSEEEHVNFQELCDLTELAQESNSGRRDPELVTVPVSAAPTSFFHAVGAVSRALVFRMKVRETRGTKG